VRHLALIVLAALVTTATAAALLARAGAAGDVTRFRTPDAGAACKLEARTLVCGSLGSDGSIAIRRAGSPGVVQRLPWWDASTPVLKRWRHGNVSCALAGRSIVCRNGAAVVAVDRDGFSLAR